jgi:hypothetical protein
MAETDTREESWRLHSAMIHLSKYVWAVGARIYEKNANASHGARSYDDHSAEIRNVAYTSISAGRCKQRRIYCICYLEFIAYEIPPFWCIR